MCGPGLPCSHPRVAQGWSSDFYQHNINDGIDEVNGELVIPRFGPTDQGVYTCFFKNYDNGTAETAATAGKTVITKNIKCKLRNGGVST